jgi:class 3 adenylate cyclase/TolB-like protein
MNAEPSPTHGKAHDDTIGTVLRTLVLCDLADSTMLVEKLGDKTAAELIRRHDRLVRVAVQRHGGSEIDKTDGFLLLFERPIEAVAFALEYQRGLRALAEESKQPLTARVGVHVGEVVVWENTPADVAQGAKPIEVEGLAKPVAARLMGLALPGQILLSTVAQSLAQRGDREANAYPGPVRWLAHGRYQLKGVPEPVAIYEVGEPGIAPMRAPPDSSKAWRSKAWWRRPVPVAIAALAFSVAIGVLLSILKPWKPAELPPLRLAVAILPFTAVSADPEDTKFAGELTREMTSGVGWMRMTQVVSRDLAAAYKGKPIDPRRVGRELDASYLLQGQVRHLSADQIDVNVQLIDASTGAQLWNEGVRGDMDTVLAKVTDRTINGIKAANMRRYAGPPAPNASALELTWHAYSVLYGQNNTADSAIEAHKWFERALQLDPNFLPAIRGLATALESELDLDPKADQTAILRQMDKLSFRAVTLDSSDGMSWQLRTTALIRLQRWDAALEANDKGFLARHRAEIMVMLGRPQEALALADQDANLQDHQALGWAMLQRCRACMALGRYEDAIAACDRNVAVNNWWLPHVYMMAGYALQGEADRAAAEKAVVLELRPGASIAVFKKLYWSDNPAFVQQTETHLLAGLRKAGFPEQ